MPAAPIVEDVAIVEQAEVVVEVVEDEDEDEGEDEVEEVEVVSAGGAAGDEDLEGARLIALDMALNGRSRDETDEYLAQNFDLADRERLLDEVYAAVEG